MRLLLPAERASARSGLISIFLVLLATLPFSANVHAQETPLRFVRLSTDEGLSESTTQAIVQDRRGFMWFGTANGLNRYDGYSFTAYHYDAADSTSLSNNVIRDLFVDSEGGLWIGTEGGLNRYVRETDSFIRYQHDKADASSLSNDFVHDILEDRHGQLWVATSKGLNRLDRTTNTFVHFRSNDRDLTGLSDDQVRVLYEDRAGRLWMGTNGGGLKAFDPEQQTFIQYPHDPDDPTSLSHNLVLAIHESRDGDLWVGTMEGLNRLDRATNTFTRFLHDARDPSSLLSNEVWAIHEDQRGRLWVGSDGGGLSRFDHAEERFDHVRHDPANPTSLSSNVVRTIYEDQDGNLWIGNFAGGINFLDIQGRAFTHYQHNPDEPHSLPHNAVSSFLEDAEGHLWVGTDGGGLSLFDAASGRFTPYQHDPRDLQSLSSNAVLSLCEDRNGMIWLGTWKGGLNRFDKRAGTFERYLPDADNPHSLSDPNVWALLEDRKGHLWAGTFGGLNRLVPGTAKAKRSAPSFIRYRHDPADSTSLPHDIVWTLYEDRRGRLWTGTHDGLSLYDRDRDAFVNYRHDPQNPNSLSHGWVMAIYEDQAGRLWIGTHGGGLNLFDPDTAVFLAYRTEDGLPSDVIYGILEDGRGNLWLSTNKGLSRFNVRTNTFNNYDRSDGLQGRQFNRNAYFKSRSGALFFGGINGLNSFNPDSVKNNTVVPPVVITDFQLFNKPVAPGDASPLQKHITEAETITLRHDQSVFSFMFAALNFRNPEKNQYAYKLEGFDDDWIYAGATRTTTYTNLDPGTYVFRVRGSNNSGLWNNRGASVSVVVRPPYWATWWFRLLGVTVMTTLLFTAYHVRTRSIRRHNKQLMEEIIERKRAKREREHLMAVMEEKNIELESKNAELERFIYTVSHDLKSPLVTIRGFLGLLEQDALNGNTVQMKQDMQHINAAAVKMQQLLNELLELSRIGRLMNPPEAIPLTHLAHEALGLVASLIEERHVTVVIDPSLPVVYGDRHRLREVLQNLIENSVKYMGDQPEPQIEIGMRQDRDEMVLFVRDNGVGIEPRFHEKVFGLFERLNAGTEGTGVGLALVKRIVEVHGGRIWVESEGKDQGTTICVVLPLMEHTLAWAEN